MVEMSKRLCCNSMFERSTAQHPVLRCQALLPLAQALMAVNSRLRELYPDSEELFDIVLMTNNHAQVGVRLINSINHYGTLSPQPNIDRLSAACSDWNGCHSVIKTHFCHLHPSSMRHRFDHRAILYDGREKPYRLPQGLHDKPVPLQRFRKSHRGHRRRYVFVIMFSSSFLYIYDPLNLKNQDVFVQ